MTHILVVDDDIHIGNMLEEVLTKNGCRVSRAYSGTEALMLTERSRFDLILLDLMLPGMSGEELLKRIKDTPVIVLSAKADSETKVGVLLGGAYDYMAKPFDINELLARITLTLRTHSAQNEKSGLSFAGIELDTATHLVKLNGTEIKLTRTEYAILKLLMINHDQVTAKLTILDKISEDTPDCTESSLKQHISNLRKKLKEADGEDHIESVWGIGFKLR